VHLSPWLARHVTKQVKDLVPLARGTCVAATGRGFFYLRFNSNRDMEAVITIETSGLHYIRDKGATINIYRRPNPNLQLNRCLCVTVSLYSALQAVVPTCHKYQMARLRIRSGKFTNTCIAGD
jgi:hypothetical protein